MDKRLKSKLWALAAALVLVIFLAAGAGSMRAQAGFGDFNDYDSGSDWDSGYDYDSGSDYDYDYDSGSDWDSGSSYRGSGEARPVLGIIVGIISLMICLGIMNLTGRAVRKTRGMFTSVSKSPQRRTVPKVILPDRTAQISKIIMQKDPLFTAPDFISFAKQIYVDIQDAWAKRDLEPVRCVLHQNLYQQTERQIQKKIADGIVNHLERISVNTTYLTSYRRDKQFEYVTLYMAASMIDYQVKEATGEIILGNKETRWNMQYKMTFQRSADAKTRMEKDKGFVCPNCGAPLQGTSFGKCEYCDSVVTSGAYDWVLSSFGVVKNDTLDEGIVVNDEAIK